MKRGANEGSIYRRTSDGQWTGVLTTGYDAKGRRQRRTFYGRTRGEVTEKLKAAQRRVDDGLPLVDEHLTVAAFLARWLEGKRHDLRAESHRRYADYIRLYLAPELGRIKLAKLTAADVQAAYARIRDRGLSGTTVQLAHGVLHKALDDAARWDLVIRNVTGLIDTPRRTTPEMRSLTPAEAMRLFEAAHGDPLEAFYMLAVTAGLRLGELQALRWHDIDLDARHLTVSTTFQGFANGEPVLSEPKTQRSRRTVVLSVLAIDALRAHRTRQLEQRLGVGPLWEDRGFVFANSLGKPLDGNNLRERSFRRLLERAGLPPMRFHDLRHSAATLLMAEGVPVKAISEMLGHADITTTLRVYTHVLPTMHAQAAAAMDRLFGAR